MKLLARSLVFALVLSPLACSSNDAGGGATDDGGTNSGKCRSSGVTYPSGPCGSEVGMVIPNFAFEGRLEGASSAWGPISLAANYHDPDGTKGNRYLVVNVSALWCVYCKEEAAQLSSLKTKYGPKGVRFLTDLTEKLDGSPADQADVDAWISVYKLDTAVVNDPTFVFGTFFEKAKMPLNMIIDLKTMKIAKKIVGADLPAVTAELDRLTGS
jgi:thiol-disulfide isomerase/thioredoxin